MGFFLAQKVREWVVLIILLENVMPWSDNHTTYNLFMSCYMFQCVFPFLFNTKVRERVVLIILLVDVMPWSLYTFTISLAKIAFWELSASWRCKHFDFHLDQPIPLTIFFNLINYTGYIEPVMVILHELELTWAGRVSWKHHTCMVSALSISTTLKQQPLIWSASVRPC